ncbi:ABC-type transporter, integral membrane subunit [Gemmatirosa kalamazoonensis]|uniref:ABC-type transporter, integral membrane subunit n=1 Tax=Gemmatirosa kalamazoonensis TaxID=861299 RepID=W0RHT2_9BACT|nr:iron ABC transporter permease [Gemmatirosa kalamazoonensis]AHG90669.1 ABC-type transporter, integral membrane subunit [Gemmatirosa kalamazoonensis]
MRLRYWIAGAVALALLAIAGVALGAVTLPVGAVWAALRGAGDPTTLVIVRDLRLPRVALAALVGAGLGTSGAALQGALRNPLAEPYLLGVSGGAAVGAVIATGAGLSIAAALPIGAFGGAVAAAAAVLGVARAAGGIGDARLLVMAGVVVGAFANAAVMILLAAAPADTVRNALWWMMGSASDARWPAVRWLALYALVSGTVLVAGARDLDALALGADPAAALGVDVDRASRRVFVTATLLAAATVSAAGLVGFVGLVVPHLARACGARAHRPLLLAAGLFGAALLVGADVVARVAHPPVELPLGAVTAMIGVPFFLWRLRATR